MNDAVYNGAWDAIEHILEEYIDLRRNWSFSVDPCVTQDRAERVKAQVHEKIRSALRPFGVTYADLCLELDRRVRHNVRNTHETRKAKYRNWQDQGFTG